MGYPRAQLRLVAGKTRPDSGMGRKSSTGAGVSSVMNGPFSRWCRNLSLRMSPVRRAPRASRSRQPERPGWRVLFLLLAVFFPANTFAAPQSSSGFTIESSEPGLQRVFDAAVLANRRNLARHHDGREVLIEGDIWRGLWLETQPMGGAMFGRFQPRIARNNFEIILEGQRADGLLPHLTHLDGNRWYGTGIPGCEAIGFNAVAAYGIDVYYLLDRDKIFLDRLAKALETYDAYLWANRDKNGNGLLEAYGSTDTGEDGQAGHRYHLGRDPDGKRFVESVSVMADSHANRLALAQIAAIRAEPGLATRWETAASELRQRAEKGFWDEERGAAFDLDETGKPLPTLNQLNLRAMAQGLFSPAMARTFTRRHLMNPEAFFTPYPIPSTAIHDPGFENVENSREYASWTGPSMGLTLQRAVRALESYGLYAEVGLIGERLLRRIAREPVVFPVQFDPLTGEAVSSGGPYGPMVLATLEYLSRMYAVHPERDRILWSGLSPGRGQRLSSRLEIHGKRYHFVNESDRIVGYINGEQVFEGPHGLRIVTDTEGKVLEVIGIANHGVHGNLTLARTKIEGFSTLPNQVHRFSGGKLHPVPEGAAP